MSGYPPWRRFFVWLFLIGAWFVCAKESAAQPSFQEAFDKHIAIMLLIDPGNGEIVDANLAATRFYGYSHDDLRTMSIQQINQLSPEQVAAERQLAKSEGRNYFIFRHKLADQSVRTVEVHSVPLQFEGRTLLYSIIRDISKERHLQEDLWHYQTRLEQMVDAQTAKISHASQQKLLILGGGAVLLLLLVISLFHTLARTKRAEASLRQSERQNRFILNTVPDLVWLKDEAGVYLACNPMFERFFGAKEADILGKTDYDFVDPGLADFFRKHDLIAMEAGKPSVNEEWVTFADDGHRALLETIKTPLKDEAGKLIGVLGIGRDITQRKQAESMLDKFFEQPMNLHVIAGHDGTFRRVNAGCETMLGYSPDELEGRVFLEMVHPDDVEPTLQEMEKLANGKITFNFENRYKHKSGGFRRLAWSAIASADDDLIYGVASDVTEQRDAEQALKESEDRFRNLLNSTAEAIYGLDTDGNCTFCNPAGIRMLGFDHEDELLGKNMHEISHHSHEDGSTYPAQDCLIYKAFREQRKSHSESEVFWRKDGTSFPVEYWSYPLWRDDELVGAVVTFFDITDRKRMLSQMLEAKDEAEKASKSKSEFLASMSHELRTPLNAVLGFAQMMQFDPNNPLTKAQNDHINSILEGGNHLLALVNEILDLARIESNQIPLSISSVNVNDIVQDCVAMSRPLGETRGIEITDKLSQGPDTVVRTDPQRFKQVLLNLLSNAVKFNVDGGQVIVEGHETDRGFIRIAVRDTGIGIAEEDQGGVFQMFQRLGADPMVSQEGTGIGLTVTKLLVERMAGQIGFDSEKGQGSTFWIELPLSTNDKIIIWDDSLRVGVDPIDKDHQVMIGMLNQVSRENLSSADMSELVQNLVDYASYHFKREEAVMEACGYPQLIEHSALHEQIKEQLEQLSEDLRKGWDEDILARLRMFLQDLWYVHLMDLDAELPQYTKGKEQQIQQALDDLG